jgi:general stress protein YciG
MAGTLKGGKAAAKTNKMKYGEDFYAKIGEMGGKKGTTGGFYYQKHVLGNDDFAREAGRKGGHLSKRGPAHV